MVGEWEMSRISATCLVSARTAGAERSEMRRRYRLLTPTLYLALQRSVDLIAGTSYKHAVDNKQKAVAAAAAAAAVSLFVQPSFY